MEAGNMITIGLDTPIAMLTPRQLFDMQKSYLGDMVKERPPEPKKTRDRWFVYSLQELADAIGTSMSTVSRMKAAGVLDESISQYGRWLCIDVESVIEKFRLSNRGRKKRNGNP